MITSRGWHQPARKEPRQLHGGAARCAVSLSQVLNYRLLIARLPQLLEQVEKSVVERLVKAQRALSALLIYLRVKLGLLPFLLRRGCVSGSSSLRRPSWHALRRFCSRWPLTRTLAGPRRHLGLSRWRDEAAPPPLALLRGGAAPSVDPFGDGANQPVNVRKKLLRLDEIKSVGWHNPEPAAQLRLVNSL